MKKPPLMRGLRSQHGAYETLYRIMGLAVEELFEFVRRQPLPAAQGLCTSSHTCLNAIPPQTGHFPIGPSKPQSGHFPSTSCPLSSYLTSWRTYTAPVFKSRMPPLQSPQYSCSRQKQSRCQNGWKFPHGCFLYRPGIRTRIRWNQEPAALLIDSFLITFH